MTIELSCNIFNMIFDMIDCKINLKKKSNYCFASHKNNIHRYFILICLIKNKKKEILTMYVP